MKSKLKKLNEKEIRNYLPDVAILSRVKGKKDPVLWLVEAKRSTDTRIDPLLDLEISLRKCERLGVFRK